MIDKYTLGNITISGKTYHRFACRTRRACDEFNRLRAFQTVVATTPSDMLNEEEGESEVAGHMSCPHSYPLFYESLGLDEGHAFLEIGLGAGCGAGDGRADGARRFDGNRSRDLAIRPSESRTGRASCSGRSSR